MQCLLFIQSSERIVWNQLFYY